MQSLIDYGTLKAVSIVASGFEYNCTHMYAITNRLWYFEGSIYYYLLDLNIIAHTF